MLAGHPIAHGNWLVTGGTFTGKVAVAGITELRSELPGAVGDSGGPLFDLNGQVMGVVRSEIVLSPPPPDIAPVSFGIVWNWDDFAHVYQTFVAAVPAADARARATAIIANQGNVP